MGLLYLLQWLEKHFINKTLISIEILLEIAISKARRQDLVETKVGIINSLLILLFFTLRKSHVSPVSSHRNSIWKSLT